MNCYLEPRTFLSEMIRLIFIFVQYEVDAPFRKPFEIDGADTRRELKLTAGVSMIR